MIKFEVKDRHTKEVRFTAEIECEETAPRSTKLGLAIEWAIKNKVYLTGVDFRGVDFRGADLRWVDFSGADLREADLREADFRGADLRGADLTRASLRWASLTGASLSEADLSEADLRWADLREADLSEADLRWADLRWANFRKADLTGADLRWADLREVDFREADLRWIHLAWVNLAGANIAGANLAQIRLAGANLKDTYIEIPKIENIHQKVAEAVKGGDLLDMNHWHIVDHNNECGTKHCRAGWVITLAGEEGAELERLMGPSTAAYSIYSASDPTLEIMPDFHCSDEEAMKDILACAEKEKAQQGAKQ